MAESLKYAENFMKVGTNTVASGGTAETVTLGWRPRYVKAFSVNNLAIYEHFAGMTAATSLDTANHETTQISVNAAGSITLSDTGFTLGADICDTTSDVVHWIAFR